MSYLYELYKNQGLNYNSYNFNDFFNVTLFTPEEPDIKVFQCCLDRFKLSLCKGDTAYSEITSDVNRFYVDFLSMYPGENGDIQSNAKLKVLIEFNEAGIKFLDATRDDNSRDELYLKLEFYRQINYRELMDLEYEVLSTHKTKNPLPAPTPDCKLRYEWDIKL